MSDGVSLVAGRVKNPCGPMNASTVPGSTSCSQQEPGPPCTRVTAMAKRGVPSGGDAIE